MINSGALFAISGPSGVGKTSVVNKLLEMDDHFCKTISCTTRAIRDGEKDGVDYIFISEESFNHKINDNQFLEWEKINENLYGTLLSQVNDLVSNGKVVFLVIDVYGVQALKSKLKMNTIFILPPSMEVLSERIIKRGTESQEQFQIRMKRAEEELSFSSLYDYEVVCNDIDSCSNDIYHIVLNTVNKI